MNPAQLQHAAKMFIQCTQLKNIPDMRFPKIKNLRSLVLVGSNDDGWRTQFTQDNSDELDNLFFAPEQVFAGCPLVYDLPEFDEKMKELEEWCKVDAPSANVDENGYLILKSVDEARASLKFLRKFPGIRIDSQSAAGWFRGLTVYVKNINLKGVKDASSMFKQASVQALGKLENTESLEDISYMFYHAIVARIPDIIAPSCKKAYNAFAVASSGSGATHPPKNLVLNPACLSYTNSYGDRRTANDIMSEVLFPGTSLNKNWPWQWTKLSDQIYGGFSDGIRRSEDGWIIVDVPEQMRIIAKSQKLLKEVPGIRFAKDGAKKAFSGINVPDAEFPTLDLGGVEDATCMFEQCKIKSIAGFVNTQSIKNGFKMFYYAQITGGGLEGLELPALENGESMFYDCSLGKPLDSKFFKSLQRLTVARQMFYGTKNIVPHTFNGTDFDLRSLYSAVNMFTDSGIEKIEDFECKTVVDVTGMFSGNNSLKSVGSVSFEHATNAQSLFRSCGNLEEVGELLLPAATNLKSLFSICGSLKMVGTLDMSNARSGSVESMFSETGML